MKNPGKKKKAPAWIERIAAHPVIVLAMLALAVIGLAVMIALFFVSQEERELVYAVNPVKTRVVAMGQVTGLEIIHNEVELGDVDITVAQVAIWNSGDESIRPEHILREVVICTEPAVKILEASVVKHSREFEVTKFTVIESRELMDTGKVPVSWQILEQNDGASIQLIYLGSPEIKISAEGLIEGSGEIKRVGRKVKIKTPAEQFRAAQTPWWFYLIMPAMVISFIFFFGREVYRDWKKRRRAAIIQIIMLSLMVGFTSFAFWELLGRGPLAPPFGF